MSNHDGGPAFPHRVEGTPSQHGMSLWDWYTGKAVEGLLADHVARLNGSMGNPQSVDPVLTASIACDVADAVILERQRRMVLRGE